MDDAHARDAAATVALPDAYRLLEVLGALGRDVATWGSRVPMCAVTLDQPLLVGVGCLVWRASLDGRLQSGLTPREFLTAYRGATPRLALDAAAWLFDELASPRRGPVPVRAPDQARIAAALRAGCAAQAEITAALAARRAAEPGAPAWTTCPVCNGIAAHSFAQWQAGELPTDAYQVADRYLEILGAPHFGDSVGSRDWCIKRCGVCATHYHWKGDYEYLAGGSEDTITITRLGDDELPGWLAQVDARVRAATGAG
ncbi:MAG: hypothetical protein JNK64_19620 [Myxococcales bacterium]|nr:hypothetical protein [Myxococcales bacterium]